MSLRSKLPLFPILAVSALSALVSPAPANALFNCQYTSDTTVPDRILWWGAGDSDGAPTMNFTVDAGADRVPVATYWFDAAVPTTAVLRTSFKAYKFSQDGADDGRQATYLHELQLDNATDFTICHGPVETYKKLVTSVPAKTIFYQGRPFDANTWKACRIVRIWRPFPNPPLEELHCSYDLTAHFYSAGGTSIGGGMRYTQLSNVNGDPNPKTLTFNMAVGDWDNDGLSTGQEWLHNTDPYDADTDNDGVKDGADWCSGFVDPTTVADARRGLFTGVNQNEVFNVGSPTAAVNEAFSVWYPRKNSSLPTSVTIGGKAVTVAHPSGAPALSNNLENHGDSPAWVRDGVLDYTKLSGTLNLTSYLNNTMGANGKWAGWSTCTGSASELKCNLNLSMAWPAGGGFIGTSDQTLLDKVSAAIQAHKCVGSYLAELPGAAAMPLKTSLRWPTADADGDKLSNVAEQALGSNPLAADSDGDGLSDGDEECACMPNDTACQAQRTTCRRTNALSKDSDGDSYADNCPAGTSNCVADTCHHYFQQLPDGTTARSVYPLADVARTPQDDCDMDDDGLSDGDELALYPTGDCLSCNNPDVDGDGIPDSQEGTANIKLADVVVTLLYHPAQLSTAGESTQTAASRAQGIANRVQTFFAGNVPAGQPPKVRLTVTAKAVSGNLTLEQFQNDCRHVTGGADGGIFLLPANLQDSLPTSFVPRNVDAVTIARGPAAYGLTNREALYTHVARLCLAGSLEHDAQGNVWDADFGEIRSQGSSEFIVRFPPRPFGSPGTQLAAYDSGLVGAISHQLGHSLNLHHGGRTVYDCNPFYPSVMNHAYDFQPNVETCGVDVRFSSGAWAPLANDPSRDIAHLSVPMSERGWPKVDNASTVDALGCWAFGDGLPSDAITSCTGAQSGAGNDGDMCYYCEANTSCYDLLEFESRVWEDALYAYQVAHVRVAGSLLEPRISGCDASVLYPDEGSPTRFDLPEGTLMRDHDDDAWMNQSLAVTVPYGRFRFEQSETCDAQSASCPASTLDVPVVEPRGPGNFPRWLARDAFAITPAP